MVSSTVQRVTATLFLQGQNYEVDVPVEDTLLGALKTLKGRTMTIMNESMAESKDAADEVVDDAEEDIELEEDEIQKIAGDTSHKKKKRKIGF